MSEDTLRIVNVLINCGQLVVIIVFAIYVASVLKSRHDIEEEAHRWVVFRKKRRRQQASDDDT